LAVKDKCAKIWLMKKPDPIVQLFPCFIVIVVLEIFIFHLSPSIVNAQQPEPWVTPRCALDDVATIQGFECIFQNIVRILVPVAGLALFIMLIIGSFQLITAGGEAKQIQKARNTITYAVFGLVLLLGTWFILLLIKTITGVDVTQFIIPGP